MSLHSEMDRAFWAEGSGAMSWTAFPDDFGQEWRALAVILPNERTASLIFVSHAEGNWARRGPKFGWNGDLDRPTFKPSIQGDSWHGYITHGEFTNEACPDSCCEIAERRD